MKVLLVYPCSANELIGYGDLGAIAEPLALEYLAAVRFGLRCRSVSRWSGDIMRR
jgi:hypothetical protein